MSISFPQTEQRSQVLVVWFGGCHDDFSEGSWPMQEGRRSGPYNGSSHVLAVDSSASVVLAAEQEEVHIVVGELFFFKLSPDGQTMAGEGEKGGLRKGEAIEGNEFAFVFVSLSLLHKCKRTISMYRLVNVFNLFLENKVNVNENLLVCVFFIVILL